MKKYTVVLFAVTLLITFIGFNINSANAANCAPGDLFNTTTGQPCDTTTIVECTTGDLYSGATGERCTMWRDNVSPSRLLEIGSRGEDVRVIQQILKDQNYSLGIVDGVYGPRTERAVRKFQEDNYLIVTGKVDADTLAKLNAVRISSSVVVLSPNGGENWQKGTTQTIRWQDNTPVPACALPGYSGPSCLISRDYDIRLIRHYLPCTTDLCPASLPVFIEYIITRNIQGTEYKWSVGKLTQIVGPYGLDPVPDGLYIIQVCQLGTNTCDSSNAPFTITSSTSPTIKVTYPNGGQVLKIGDKQTISYQIKGDIKGEYRVSLVLEPGFIPLTIQPVTSSSYEWTIPKNVAHGGDAIAPLTPGSYKIIASLYDSVPCVGFCVPTGAKLLASDESDGYFIIN